MSLFENAAPAEKDTTDTTVENTASEKNPLQDKVVSEKDNTVTLQDEKGNQITNVPKDKVADKADTADKVEYPKEVLELIPEKFRNANDPMKAWQEAHKGLETKLRAKPEAPEEYTVNLPESAKKAGIEIDQKDPRFTKYAELAKAGGFTQEQFDAGIEAFLEGEMASGFAKEKEMEKLGKEGPTMLKETAQRLTRHLGETEAMAILDQITTAEGAKQLSRLAGMVGRESNIPSSDGQNAAMNSHDELSEYRSRIKDPKMKSDREFRKETLAMGEKLKDVIAEDIKSRGIVGNRSAA